MRDWLPACRLHDVEMELVFATLARTGDAHLLTIFGDRSAGQCEPLFAECGGMLYLLDTRTDRNGTTGTMLGLLPGHAVLHGRLAALGLQSVELGSEMLRGHAFHYSSLQTPLTPYTYARRTNGTAPGEAVYRHGSILASYLHCYFPSSPRATAALFQP